MITHVSDVFCSYSPPLCYQPTSTPIASFLLQNKSSFIFTLLVFGSLLGVLASLGLWKKCYFPPIYWTPKQHNRDKYLWAISKALSLPRLHFPILLFTCSVPIPIPNSIHETHPKDYGSNYASVSHFLFSLSSCMESKWYHNFELHFFFQFWGSIFFFNFEVQCFEHQLCA